MAVNYGSKRVVVGAHYGVRDWLSSSAGQSLVRYTLDNLPSKVLAREYRLVLPDEKRLAKEMEKARKGIERRSQSAQIVSGLQCGE